LNKAKSTDIAVAMASIFNAIQDEICHLQPINGILDILLGRRRLKVYFYRRKGIILKVCGKELPELEVLEALAQSLKRYTKSNLNE